MQPNFEIHAEEEQLESYALGRLSESECAFVEEHLLVCSSCQDRLEQLDQFVAAMQDAAPRLQRLGAAESLKESRRWWEWGNWWGWLPKPVGAVALAGLATLFVMVIWQRESSPKLPSVPAEVKLSLFRGAEAPPAAPAGRPLHLVLDLQDLERLPRYRVEIVNGEGEDVAEGRVSPDGNELRFPLEARLRPGNYWVRLYPDDASHALLREFALRLN